MSTTTTGTVIASLIVLVVGIWVGMLVINTVPASHQTTANINDEVVNFDTTSAEPLAHSDIMSGSVVVVNSSNMAQTAYILGTDYTVDLGNRDTLGSITTLRNYSMNSTNTVAVVSGGVPKNATATHVVRNSTFNSGTTHVLRLGIFNATNQTVGANAANFMVLFNGNFVANATLTGATTEVTYTNISGSWFTMGSIPAVSVIGPSGSYYSINYSSLVTTGFSGAFVDYTYYPPSASDLTFTNVQSTFWNGLTLLAVGLIVAAAAVIMGYFGLGMGRKN